MGRECRAGGQFEQRAAGGRWGTPRRASWLGRPPTSPRCSRPPFSLQYECRLCLTLHTNEGNYLAHTQGGLGRHRGWPAAGGQLCCRCGACFVPPGSLPPSLLSLPTRPTRPPPPPPPPPLSTAGKRHQQNLAKRAARDEADRPVMPAPQRRVAIKKTVRIGRPGYRVTKQHDPETGARGLLFQVRCCACCACCACALHFVHGCGLLF